MQYKIPETMRAMVLTGPGKFEVQTVPVPVPGPEEVLCRIGGVAICGSDPEIFRGDIAGVWPPHYPFIAGHEWAGRVVAVGPGVTKFKVGDRVCGEAHKGCGHCRNCLEGHYTTCLNYGNYESGQRHYGFINNGAYCQYNVYHIKSLTPMPDSVSYKEGAMADTAGVALHGIELACQKPGSTVAVIGPGPIGIMAMKISKALGAGRVIVIGRGSRLQSAIKLGCDDAVDFTACDPVEKVRELTGGLGVDVCYECSGAKGTINQGIRMCRRKGKVVMLGVAPDNVTEEIPLRYTTANEISILGSKANPNTGWKVMELISRGNISVESMVTHTFDLEHIADAIDTFVNRKDNVMKVVIYPNGGEDA
ncbi:MAG: zinc-binding dehydrogenase [Bacillota bacterium]|jgi:L-iditol 2-dehydrogenase|nr:zinc-binding dehydrogenase [Bacillota bacterium]NLV64045.1 zinc-binding dehydrogenase [Clostridiaceae bacterium]